MSQLKRHDSTLFWQVMYHPMSGNFIGLFLGYLILITTKYVNGPDYGIFDQKWVYLLGVTVLPLWTIRLHAYREAERIYDQKTINHTQRFCVRALIMLGAGTLIHVLLQGWGFYPVVRGIFLGAYFGSVFFFVFDPILSTDRGLPVFYVSSWYKSSDIDKFFAKVHSPTIWLLTKITLWLLCLWLYTKVM